MQEEVKETVHKCVKTVVYNAKMWKPKVISTESIMNIVLTNILDTELSYRMTLTKLKNLSAKVSASDLESILRQVWVNELCVLFQNCIALNGKN
jgi:hypothetical protein